MDVGRERGREAYLYKKRKREALGSRFKSKGYFSFI